ncbi:nitroreductase family protein [Micromonospora sp. NPDC005806]|uniref:nitroreductase family protein n=1 Tax=Micromonospora sp. NPDC005806 TaxID=3364234 RepID=UPI003690C956
MDALTISVQAGAPHHNEGDAMTMTAESDGHQVGTPPPDAATYDQLLALARHRRSVRAIDPHREVPDETIDKILEVARWAPSAGNAQPWEFLVVRDAETRKRIAELYARQMADKREMQEAVWGHRDHIGYTGFRHSPVFVLVLGDPRVIDAYPVRTALEKGESHFVTSLAQATVFAHLAVASLGLGSQWVSDVSSPYMSTMIKSWLGIPRHMRIYDMFGVGYPAVMPAPTSRRGLDEIVHHERYDQDRSRDQEAVERFLWDDTLLGGFRSNNGLKGRGPTEGPA